jgi:hypothetical protein
VQLLALLTCDKQLEDLCGVVSITFELVDDLALPGEMFLAKGNMIFHLA